MLKVIKAANLAATCVLLLVLSACGSGSGSGGGGLAGGGATVLASLQTVQNPTVTAGNASVTIQWSPVVGATSYDIYWSNTPGVTKETGNRLPNASSPFLHSGLANGTTYYYVISATGPDGEVALSAQLSATPQGEAPSAALNLTVTAGDASATIQWAAVAGAVSYNVYWSNSPGVTKASGNKITGVTALSFSHTGLTNGTTYYYVITSVGVGGGESSESAQVSATPGTALPDVPQNPTATAGESSATIQWSAVAGAISYNIYWSNTPGVTKANGNKIAGVTSPFIHDGLIITGITYYYVITAVGAGGVESAESLQVSATPFIPLPSPPQGLTATVVNSSANLQWSAVADATHYFIYWSNTAGAPKESRTRITSFTNTFVHGPLNRGTTYYYVVTAVGPGGESAISAEVSVTPGLIGDAQLIEGSDSEDARAPQVALDGSGNAIAVWHQDNGTRTSIWANRYDATTRAWGTPQLIETNDEGNAVFPQLAVDNAGNFTVVWLQNELFNDNWAANVWSNRFNAATGAWETARRVKNHDGQGAIDYQVAVDAVTGDAIAVWDQYDGARYNVWANRYSRSTGAWGAPQLLETGDAGTAAYPQVAIDSNGAAIAVWQQSDGAKFNVWANRYANGSWGTAQAIEGNAGDAYLPKVCIDNSGNAMVVWQQNDGTRFNIWANRYGAGGGSWGTAQLIQSVTTENAYGVSIAVDSGGNAIAAWNQGVDNALSIWACRYSAATGTWDSGRRFDTGGTSVYPRVTFDGSDNATVVWTHSSGDIWSNIYTASAGSWGTSQADFRFTGLPFTGLPVIAVNASGNSMAVWEMYSAGRYNIWANRSL